MSQNLADLNVSNFSASLLLRQPARIIDPLVQPLGVYGSQVLSTARNDLPLAEKAIGIRRNVLGHISNLSTLIARSINKRKDLNEKSRVLCQTSLKHWAARREAKARQELPLKNRKLFLVDIRVAQVLKKRFQLVHGETLLLRMILRKTDELMQRLDDELFGHPAVILPRVESHEMKRGDRPTKFQEICRGLVHELEIAAPPHCEFIPIGPLDLRA